MKFREIAVRWVEFKKNYVKRSTMSAYTLLLDNHLLPDFGEMETVIDENIVQAYILKKLEGGLSQKSVVDIVIVLKMILKYGVKCGVCELKPWDLVYPTKHQKEGIEVFSKTDHKKILNYIVEHFTFRNLGVYMCLCSGMRIGEVCALKWEDLDIDSGTININRTIQRIYSRVEGQKKKTELIIDSPKTKNSIREIPMNSEMIKMIKPIMKIANPSFYVLTNEAKPTEPRTYRAYYKNLMSTLGMRDLKFHGLRHSFATRCVENNCDIKTVSVLLGHSNISTTLNLYVHPNAEQKKKAIDQMFKSMR